MAENHGIFRVEAAKTFNVPLRDRSLVECFGPLQKVLQLWEEAAEVVPGFQLPVFTIFLAIEPVVVGLRELHLEDL